MERSALPQDRDSRVHRMGFEMSRQASCSFHLPCNTLVVRSEKGRLHGHFAVYSPRHHPPQLQSDDGRVGLIARDNGREDVLAVTLQLASDLIAKLGPSTGLASLRCTCQG
ncbi:hypothetical protein MAPG_04990 [Magnaporthiopsis poae ATCC 64411]|uniref:Uncharacterized protein n=1 Tax=Magnaporthiopsis poae (strain ATCC 64411 / 73-15) TaxID=644358 RepID=A0A0C4DY79_MAGP6|nr:hypothetical protein MAPG_04990 [Magnaporthiopsis poae ATCC 64411]